MKKLCICLCILLLISCAFLFRNSGKLTELNETRTQLIHENESLRNQNEQIAQNIKNEEETIERLSEETAPLREARETWEQRTEEIRGLLSD